MKFIAAAGLAAAVLIAPVADAATARRGSFGKLPDGRQVASVTLSNAGGISATVIAYGATRQSVVMPDRAGRKADVALGYVEIGD